MTDLTSLKPDKSSGFDFKKTNYYEVLNLDASASRKEICKAYRKLALALHPDRKPGKNHEFLNVQTAYQILSNKGKRKEYDRYLRLKNLLFLKNKRLPLNAVLTTDHEDWYSNVEEFVGFHEPESDEDSCSSENIDSASFAHSTHVVTRVSYSETRQIMLTEFCKNPLLNLTQDAGSISPPGCLSSYYWRFQEIFTTLRHAVETHHYLCNSDGLSEYILSAVHDATLSCYGRDPISQTQNDASFYKQRFNPRRMSLSKMFKKQAVDSHSKEKAVESEKSKYSVLKGIEYKYCLLLMKPLGSCEKIGSISNKSKLSAILFLAETGHKKLHRIFGEQGAMLYDCPSSIRETTIQVHKLVCEEDYMVLMYVPQDQAPIADIELLNMAELGEILFVLIGIFRSESVAVPLLVSNGRCDGIRPSVARLDWLIHSAISLKSIVENEKLNDQQTDQNKYAPIITVKDVKVPFRFGD